MCNDNHNDIYNDNNNNNNNNNKNQSDDWSNCACLQKTIVNIEDLSHIE